MDLSSTEEHSCTDMRCLGELFLIIHAGLDRLWCVKFVNL